MKQLINTKKIRPSADVTRRKIAKSAIKLFVKQGFAATSISQIAQKAKINQSLIYHHFGSKEALWKYAKKVISKKQTDMGTTFLTAPSATLSLEELIHQLLSLRFSAYDKNPDLVRMISWQLLEPEGRNLLGTGSYNKDLVLAAIEKMQTEKIITKRYSAKEILVFLAQQINPSLFTYSDFNSEDRVNYLKMVTQIAIEKLAYSANE